MLLQDKVALVTGAGKGIGKGIAVRLGKEGAHVIVHYAHSSKGAEEVVEILQGLGRDALSVYADVSKSDEVQKMVSRAMKRFGRIDILVNNSGITEGVGFLDETEERWDRIIDINLKGAFFSSLCCAREMIKTKGGKIIFIGSIHSILNVPNRTAYAASKGGLDAMTRQLAIELAPHHINVNSVAPGVVHVEKLSEKDLHQYDEEIPLGFFGFPEDVASTVAFLASDEARYITGQVIFVDGGISSRMALKLPIRS